MMTINGYRLMAPNAAAELFSLAQFARLLVVVAAASAAGESLSD
ncbi:MAG TPA: hypothetical protein VF705_10235 [Longimicrobium sp.]|jgi:hypothetical protein